MDASVLQAIVPGRIAASIFNITPCKGGEERMKAIAGSAVAGVEGCTGNAWERLVSFCIL